MTVVVAWIGDRAARERVRAALASRVVLRFVDGADAVRDALREAVAAGGARLVVVEPHVDGGRPAAALVAELRVTHPQLPVVAYCTVGAEAPARMLDLARAGASEIVIAGLDDDRHRLAALLDLAERRRVADDVADALHALPLPAGVVRVVRHFLEWADRPVSVAEAAHALGIHRRTLFRRLARAHLPSPQALAGWSRLLVAARLLDDGATVEHAAAALDFPSANALRNLLQRYVRLAPRELRERGGYAYLRARFLDAVRAAAVPASAPSPVAAPAERTDAHPISV